MLPCSIEHALLLLLRRRWLLLLLLLQTLASSWFTLMLVLRLKYIPSCSPLSLTLYVLRAVLLMLLVLLSAV